jgi:hypothetical protein
MSINILRLLLGKVKECDLACGNIIPKEMDEKCYELLLYLTSLPYDGSISSSSPRRASDESELHKVIQSLNFENTKN